MLYYSGYTRRIGNVKDGSTVTDFLPTERQRGITIQSAAITFHWPPPPNRSHLESPGDHPPITHVINLIDTPGHADFTFEVLRSLRVLDGAVCILDGVAGVEAQTEEVWRQAQNYHIPKLIYVNKLDRDGAEFGRNVRDVAMKLSIWPAVCQIPWYDAQSERFQGIVDVVNLQALKWRKDGDGRVNQAFNMATLAEEDPKLANEAKKARAALVELLSEHDDAMFDKCLEHIDNPMAIPASDIQRSLRKCTLRNPSPIVPVLAGSSLRNIGVQPLLDAITMMLPNPGEAPDPEITAGASKGNLQDLISGRLKLQTAAAGPQSKQAKKSIVPPATLEACALAFKVVNDSKRGVLVYVRVYHGDLRANALVYNTNLQTTEKVPRLLQMYASDATVISHIPAGQIGVIPGLKHARTGDTLITCTGMSPKKGAPTPLNELQLRPIEIPPPVFFTGIEPESRSEEKNVADALSILLREDPSLQLSVDEDTGQQLLSGMGDLHLEIARDHLVQDLKAKATVGKIEVAYRESISARAGPVTKIVEREVAGMPGKAACTVRVRPLDDGDSEAAWADSTMERDKNVIKVTVKRPEAAPNLSAEKCLPKDFALPSVCHALQTGALAALAYGPQHRYPMFGAEVSILLDPQHHLFGNQSTPAVLASAARLATKAALKASAQAQPTALVEPMMHVKISLDEPSLGDVVHDVSANRSGQVLAIDDFSAAAEGEKQTVIDLRKVYAPPDPYESPDAGGGAGLAAGGASGSRQRQITARVPLQEMVGYLKHLRSLTAGRGTFVMSMDRFEKMGPQREKALQKEWSGGL